MVTTRKHNVGLINQVLETSDIFFVIFLRQSCYVKAALPETGFKHARVSACRITLRSTHKKSHKIVSKCLRRLFKCESKRLSGNKDLEFQVRSLKIYLKRVSTISLEIRKEFRFKIVVLALRRNPKLLKYLMHRKN